jgi:hypothetical protein
LFERRAVRILRDVGITRVCCLRHDAWREQREETGLGPQDLGAELGGDGSRCAV